MQIELDESPLADNELPDWYKKLLDDRLAEVKRDGFKGKDYRIVLKEIREEFALKKENYTNRK